MNTERHPLDFDALQRGDNISAERVERAVVMEQDHPNYRFAQMRLAEQVETHFLDLRGDDLIVRCRGGGLQILTEQEQGVYAPAAGKAGVRRYGKMYRKGASVLDKLESGPQRDRLESWLRLTAFRLQQLRKRPPPELTNGEPDQ